MKVLEIKVLRGPNYWSIKKHMLIQLLLDLEELEAYPTNKIPGFYGRLKNKLPSLHSHHCSEGVPGGFFMRVKEGTGIGHVIEHIALELQALAGMDTGFGRTRATGKQGQYYVVFSYKEEEEGIYAAKAAVRIAEALVKGENYDLGNDIMELKKLWNQHKLGPSTDSIVQEAKSRDIPAIRLDNSTYVQLGYGAKQKKIQATIASTTSNIAVDIVGDKHLTKELLTEAYLPVPFGKMITAVDNLKEVVEEVGYPIVVKPVDGNQGKGATTNINTWQDAVCAFNRAKKVSEKIVIEKFIEGRDFRALVINYKFVAAAMRTPACVKGDGKHTIQQLIDSVNADPKRGTCHENVLTTIKIDDTTHEILTRKNYTLQTVLTKGEVLFLKPTANLSTGGTATDVTDTVHPDNIAIFERVARVVGLDICGIDMMAPDLTTSIKENGGAIIELNAAPGFRMHLQPTSGPSRNVAKPVVDMLFPQGDGRIPIVAITGTNGKTTTTRLVAQMAQHAGFLTGYTTTDGVYINNELIVKGDCSGPGSAKTILRDNTVEFAVLETARGGILRSGLGFDSCDCAVITNVAEDHLGLQGIDTLEQLARVKAVVAESVKENGYAILNADDDLVYAMKDHLQCKVALFSLYPNSIRIEKHCAEGGLAAVADEGYITIRRGHHIIPVEEVAKVPVTFSGKAEYNVANVLAAILAAYTSKINLHIISQVLRTFAPSCQTTPGRANLFEFNGFTVMMDYAHNPHGVRALGKFIKSFNTVNVGVITAVGDRRNEDIIALGEEAARIFDEIIVRFDDDLRGRSKEEIGRLLQQGICNVNTAIPVTLCSTELEAVDYAIMNAKPNSLITILIDNIKKVYERVIEHQSNNVKNASIFSELHKAV